MGELVFQSEAGQLRLAGQPQRIVSLVPSITESLFALGLGDKVVGVTDWCVHPTEAVAVLPKVGGTKNPTIKAIRELKPDLVIANREENRRIDVERLEDADIKVWVTYPQTVADGVALQCELAQLGEVDDSAQQLISHLEDVISARRAAASRKTRVFCAIWRDPWMTIGADTYIHDMISICGGVNVFAEHPDRRYPKISLEDLVSANPEVILLPDEPYRFTEHDVVELSQLDIFAARTKRIHVLDGTLVSWYGPRIAQALETIPALFTLE